MTPESYCLHLLHAHYCATCSLFTAGTVFKLLISPHSSQNLCFHFLLSLVWWITSTGQTGSNYILLCRHESDINFLIKLLARKQISLFSKMLIYSSNRSLKNHLITIVIILPFHTTTFSSCCSVSPLLSFLFVSSSENPSFILHLFSQFFSQRSHLTFPFLFSSNSLNIFGAVRTYFSITVPLITSVVLSPQQHVDTPASSPPIIISLVWQLLSWKTAVTASATHTEKHMKGRGKLNDYHLNAHGELQRPRDLSWVQSPWKFWALVKTGQSGWGSSSAVGQILQDFGSVAVLDT